MTRQAAGELTYSPNENFHGTDAFSYTITDGRGGTDGANVTLAIGSINNGPMAVDDSAFTNPDLAVDIHVLDNDTHPDGDNLTIDSVTDGTMGTTTILSGMVQYVPNPGQEGDDTFTYTVIDEKDIRMRQQ